MKSHSSYSRLEGGAADEEGTSSSGSLERFLRLDIVGPRLAAAIDGLKGELNIGQ